jgi:nucleoid DNA-binding protein
MSQKYTKRKLWLLLIKELNYVVHNTHVYSIINILVEEMIKDLMAGKKIKIINFGSFYLKDLKPRKFLDLVTREVKLSGSSKTLRFKISNNLSKFINSRKVCDKEQDQ